MADSEPGFLIAREEMHKSLAEGGAPIGACLVAKDGTILGRGHNQKVQKNSPCLHAEVSAFEDANHVDTTAYIGGTLYTTLSCCDICAGCAIFFKLGRVVIGESKTYRGGNDYMASKGIEVVELDDPECINTLQTYIKEHPEVWYEGIGVKKGEKGI
ncbi:unnamed protein product [Clonostachys byssicola]|uniref:Cytosine deaminase n=1 Tax=Clonostachys byssicola TaxID=160290 RepID=A0A9N9U6N6_9HYPO|nr:unnamed protein product [Clonostachys byssicola]